MNHDKHYMSELELAFEPTDTAPRVVFEKEMKLSYWHEVGEIILV